MSDVIPGLGLESHIPTCLTQGSFKGLGVSERGRRENNAVLAVITNKQNPRMFNVATEAKSQSGLGFGKTCHCSRVVAGTSPGWGQLPAREGAGEVPQGLGCGVQTREAGCGRSATGSTIATALAVRVPSHLVPAERGLQRGRGPARPAMGRAGATGRSAPDDAASSDWPPARHSLLTMVAAQSNKPRRPLPP